MNAFSNSGRVNNVDVPLFVVPGEGSGVAATIRQTSLGVSVTDARVLAGKFTGDVHLDFFGGQQPSTGGRHFPLVRMRTARGIVRWSHTEFLFGQEVPLVVGLNPVSVAAFSTPEFVTAGNLWLWLPQLRFTADANAGPANLGIQGAVLSPTSADPQTAFDTEFDPAERSTRPFLQARLRAKWGGTPDEPSGDIGVGVHQGWLRGPDSSLVSSNLVGLDARIPLGPWLELRGEAYTGQAVRGLGGGGIGQLFTTTGEPVRDRGAWAQFVVRPTTVYEFTAGCGIADPKNADLPAGRQQNTICEGSVALRPGGPFLVAFTYRRIQTTYPSGRLLDNHLNLATGFQW
jgi:hypothetical protein